MTDYPKPEDYAQAIQNPRRSFSQAALQGAVFPRPAGQSYLIPDSGTSAVVFRARVAGRDEALRFFTARTAPSTRERYEAMTGLVQGTALEPHVPQTRWVDAGIRVRGNTWPLLRMDWVDGTPLDDFVDGLVRDGDTAGLEALARRWRALVSRMQALRFAHGDLQHGNILVRGDGELRLVDFDGLWTPTLAHLQAPFERGHPNYQPSMPGRHAWREEMDTFPALVIHLSLTVVSRHPEAWDRFWTENNLLFCKDDFASPFSTELWRYLASFHEPEIDRPAAALMEACQSGCALGTLDDLLSEAEEPGEEAAAPDGPIKWWEKTALDAVPSPRAAPSGGAASNGSSARDWREKVMAGSTSSRGARRASQKAGPPPTSSEAGFRWPTPATEATSSPGATTSNTSTVEPERDALSWRAVKVVLILLLLLGLTTIILAMVFSSGT